VAEAKEPDAAARGSLMVVVAVVAMDAQGVVVVVPWWRRQNGEGCGGRVSGKEFPAQRWAFVHRGCRKNVKGVLFAERKIKNGFFHRSLILYTRRNTIRRYLYPSYT